MNDPFKTAQQEAFADEDLEILRRREYQAAQVVIPYKPVEDPAWCKHNRELPPKPQRFSKLNKWEHSGRQVHSVMRWAVVAAGAAAAAGPLLHVIH